MTGAANLVVGNNSVSVTITAEDGTQATYTVTVVVPALSTDNTLKTFTVAGQTATDGGSLTLAKATSSAAVVATTNDANASAVITGNTNLKSGANTLTVTVTAESGAVKTYTVTLNVTPLSNDTALKVFTVNGNAVADKGTVNVDFGTTAVTVVATKNSDFAAVETLGASGLVTGNNTLSVKVTAEDGTIKTYTVTIVVSLPKDNTLASISVNGAGVLAGGKVSVPVGTTTANISAVASDSKAVVAITGNTGWKVGDNTVTIKVTAQNGAQATYTITVTVASTNDQWLAVTSPPSVAVGSVFATQAGQPSAAALANTTTQVVVNGTGWTLSLTPYWLDNKATALDKTKNMVVAAGGAVSFSGTGYAPNSEARVYLGSTLLTTVTATSGGAISGMATVPTTTTVGANVLTISGFTSDLKARLASIGMTVKAGFVLKTITIAFPGTTVTVPKTAAKLLAGIPATIKGATLVKIDIKGWAAGAKLSAALTKMGTTRATALKTAITKLKVKATFTTGFGALESAKAKTSRAVITISYAKP